MKHKFERKTQNTGGVAEAPLPVVSEEMVTDEEATLLKQLEEARAKKAVKAQEKTLVVETENVDVADVKQASVFKIEPKNTTALATKKDTSNGIIEGDWDETDNRMPRLQIVAGSGELAKKYTGGTILFDDEVLFKASEEAPTFKFIPLGLVKAYRERLDPNDKDNEGVIARVVRSKAEVIEMGGTTEWLNGNQPSWNPTATIPMLIERPTNSAHPAFGLEVEGKFYAPGVYYASNTAYRETALKIRNSIKSQLIERDENGIEYELIYKKVWTAKLIKKPSGSFVVFVFEVRLTADITSPALREVCRRFLTNTSSQKVEVTE